MKIQSSSTSTSCIQGHSHGSCDFLFENIIAEKRTTMTFTFQCYQNNFMLKNLNIISFGDCFGSIIACMAFAFLVELSRGIDLYLRHYSITAKNNNNLSLTIIRRRRLILHLLQTIVRLAQTALSYVLMLMVMNNFAGFFLSAIIALGIGYYLLNGVHPYTRSANDDHPSTSDLVNNPTDVLHENFESSQQSTLPISI